MTGREFRPRRSSSASAQSVESSARTAGPSWRRVEPAPALLGKELPQHLAQELDVKARRHSVRPVLVPPDNCTPFGRRAVIETSTPLKTSLCLPNFEQT